VATFSFAKEGHLGKFATKNRARANIGARLKAIEVNHPYLASLATRLLARPGRFLLSGGMRLRTYKNTDLTVSEVGFGLWTISTGWWGTLPRAKRLRSCTRRSI